MPNPVVINADPSAVFGATNSIGSGSDPVPINADPSAVFSTPAATNPLYNYAKQSLGQSFGQDGCARFVCHVMASAGIPNPNTENAADLEQHLINNGAQRLPISEARPGDIIGTVGQGQSGRHVGVYAGAGKMYGDAGVSSNYKVVLQGAGGQDTYAYRLPTAKNTTTQVSAHPVPINADPSAVFGTSQPQPTENTITTHEQNLFKSMNEKSPFLGPENELAGKNEWGGPLPTNAQADAVGFDQGMHEIDAATDQNNKANNSALAIKIGLPANASISQINAAIKATNSKIDQSKSTVTPADHNPWYTKAWNGLKQIGQAAEGWGSVPLTLLTAGENSALHALGIHNKAMEQSQQTLVNDAKSNPGLQDTLQTAGGGAEFPLQMLKPFGAAEIKGLEALGYPVNPEAKLQAQINGSITNNIDATIGPMLKPGGGIIPDWMANQSRDKILSDTKGMNDAQIREYAKNFGGGGADSGSPGDVAKIYSYIKQVRSSPADIPIGKNVANEWTGHTPNALLNTGFGALAIFGGLHEIAGLPNGVVNDAVAPLSKEDIHATVAAGRKPISKVSSALNASADAYKTFATKVPDPLAAKSIDNVASSLYDASDKVKGISDPKEAAQTAIESISSSDPEASFILHKMGGLSDEEAHNTIQPGSTAKSSVPPDMAGPINMSHVGDLTPEEKAQMRGAISDSGVDQTTPVSWSTRRKSAENFGLQMSVLRDLPVGDLPPLADGSPMTKLEGVLNYKRQIRNLSSWNAKNVTQLENTYRSNPTAENLQAYVDASNDQAKILEHHGAVVTNYGRGLNEQKDNAVPTLTDQVMQALNAVPVTSDLAKSFSQHQIDVGGNAGGVSFTSDNTPIGFKWAVKDASEINPSHNPDFTENKNYPQELQPRDRTRTATQVLVDKIARNPNPERLAESSTTSEGAPIVGHDLNVESGNARVMGLRKAYADIPEQGDKYRQWLTKNSGRFGINPKDVSAIKNPVLVRVRLGDPNMPIEARGKIAREMGVSQTSGMSAPEIAAEDAKRIKDNKLLAGYNTDHDIDSPENKNFVNSFLHGMSSSERDLIMQKGGRISADGIRRIRNAILATAFDDPHSIARLTESTDDNVRGVGQAMVKSAPDIARLKSDIAAGIRYPLDISNDISEAANKLSALRKSGTAVAEYLAQKELFDPSLSETGRKLLAFFDANKRGPVHITDLLKSYVAAADHAGDPAQAGLFGSDTEPTKDSILQIAQDNAKTKGAEEPTEPKAKAARVSKSGNGSGAEGQKTGRKSAADIIKDPDDAARFQALANKWKLRSLSDVGKSIITEEEGSTDFGLIGSLFPDLVEMGHILVKAGLRNFDDWSKTMKDNTAGALDKASKADLAVIFDHARLSVLNEAKENTKENIKKVYGTPFSRAWGTEVATKFESGLQDLTDGSNSTLEKLFTGQDLTPDEKSAIHEAYDKAQEKDDDGKPAKTPEVEVKRVQDINAEIRKEIADNERKAQSPDSAIDRYINYRAEGPSKDIKASDLVRQDLTDSGNDDILDKLKTGKALNKKEWDRFNDAISKYAKSGVKADREPSPLQQSIKDAKKQEAIDKRNTPQYQADQILTRRVGAKNLDTLKSRLNATAEGASALRKMSSGAIQDLTDAEIHRVYKAIKNTQEPKVETETNALSKALTQWTADAKAGKIPYEDPVELARDLLLHASGDDKPRVDAISKALLNVEKDKNGNVTAKGMAELGGIVNDFANEGFSHQFARYVQGNLLSSPATLAKILIAHIASAATEELAVRPIAHVFAPNDVAPLSLKQSLLAAKAGISKIGESVQIIGGKQFALQATNKMPYLEPGWHMPSEFTVAGRTNSNALVRGASRGFNAMERFPMRVHGAMYHMIGSALYDRALREAAWMRASADVKSGKLVPTEGQSAASLINRLTEKNYGAPTPDMLDHAREQYNYQMFQNKNAISTGLENAVKSPLTGKVNPVKSALATEAVPFTTVPSNVGGRALEFTAPGALVSAAKQMFDVKSAGGSLRSRWIEMTPAQRANIARTLSRGVVGSALTAGGYYLAKSGVESAANEKKFQPGTANVKGRHYDISGIGPTSSPSLLGAAIRQILVDQKSNGGKGDYKDLTPGAAAYNYVADQPLLKSSAGLQDIGTPKGLPSTAAGFTQEVLPMSAGLKWLAAISDPSKSVREKQTYLDYLKNGIPGLRETLPVQDYYNTKTGIPEGAGLGLRSQPMSQAEFDAERKSVLGKLLSLGAGRPTNYGTKTTK